MFQPSLFIEDEDQGVVLSARAHLLEVTPHRAIASPAPRWRWKPRRRYCVPPGSQRSPSTGWPRKGRRVRLARAPLSRRFPLRQRLRRPRSFPRGGRRVADTSPISRSTSSATSRRHRTGPERRRASHWAGLFGGAACAPRALLAEDLPRRRSSRRGSGHVPRCGPWPPVPAGRRERRRYQRGYGTRPAAHQHGWALEGRELVRTSLGRRGPAPTGVDGDPGSAHHPRAPGGDRNGPAVLFETAMANAWRPCSPGRNSESLLPMPRWTRRRSASS